VVTRLLAAILDAVIVAVLAVLLHVGVAGIRYAWSPVRFEWPELARVTSGTLALVLAVLYLTIGWAVAGRTYGQRLLGLRVLTPRHRLLGVGRSLVRAVTCTVFPIGLLWCAFSATRRSLQDLLVGSVVVYESSPYAQLADPAAAAGDAAP